MDLPVGFRRRMEEILGEAAPLFFEALSQEPTRAFRFDPEKVTREELEAAFPDALFSQVPFAENSLVFDVEGIGNHPYHHGGALYVQEPAAMAPVAALGEEKVSSVLDLCSAPGGKSLQAALLLEEGGFLVCNEPEFSRRKVLMQNLERLGERRALVTSFDGRCLPPEWEGEFDLVICDAPCSGEGMMRKSEDAIRLWSEDAIRLCAERQEKILDQGAKCVSPGGRLLYSTCTWAVEENEERVVSFLASHPDFSLIPPKKEILACSAPGVSVGGKDLSVTRRFYPHLFRGEGQFLAVFRRAGKREEVRNQKEKKKKQEKKTEAYLLAENFLREVLEKPFTGEITVRGDEVYLTPKNPFPEALFASPGTLLGEARKGRIVPHHRFFLAFARDFRNKVHLSAEDERVEAYLKGEEIPLEGVGFSVLFCGNTPLGGVKLGNGRGKNHYPKGLRKA